MVEPVKIEFEFDDIKDKSEGEKLNLLLKIAYANHECLSEHGKILFGNGEQGLVDRTRFHWKAIIAAFACIAGLAGIVSQHLLK